MEVGAEGAEEAHGVHGPAADLCVRSGGHPIRGSGQEPLGTVTGWGGHSWGKSGTELTPQGDPAALASPLRGWVSMRGPWACCRVFLSSQAGGSLSPGQGLPQRILLKSLSSILDRLSGHSARGLPLSCPFFQLFTAPSLKLSGTIPQGASAQCASVLTAPLSSPPSRGGDFLLPHHT